MKQTKLAELKAEIEKLQTDRLLVPFVNRFGEKLLAMLASTPYEKWPKVAKDCFKHAEQEMPVLAAFYADLLPK